MQFKKTNAFVVIRLSSFIIFVEYRRRFGIVKHGAFHEDCVNIIMKDLVKLMNPKYIEVTGFFTPRGGISIYPYCNYGQPGTEYEQMAKQRLKNHR